MLNLPDRYRALAEEIVGSIDEDGYLRVSLEQMAHDAGVFYGDEYTTAEAEAVLRKVQKLDPPVLPRAICANALPFSSM